MKSVILFLLFAGMFLVVHGIYEEKLKIAEQNTRVEYKFIPRTYYEEQLAEPDVTLKMGSMFKGESPWYDRTIGALSDIPKYDAQIDMPVVGMP